MQKKNNYKKDSAVYIYGLVDPIDKRVRYIGKTVSLGRRYSDHIYKSKKNKTKKEKWINELIQNGYRPSIIIIEECNKENWEEREKFYIKKYREINKDLLNISDGGKGDFWAISSHKKKYIGIYKNGKYYAKVFIGEKYLKYGGFETEYKAAEAFDIVTIKFYGPKNVLNFENGHVYTTNVKISYKKLQFYKDMDFLCMAKFCIDLEGLFDKKDTTNKEKKFIKYVRKRISNLYKYSSPEDVHPIVDYYERWEDPSFL